MADTGAGYTFLKWNGTYGMTDSKFVVRDESTGKQALFTPGHTDDVVWTNRDLAAQPEFSEWEDFGDEHVDDLDKVAF